MRNMSLTSIAQLWQRDRAKHAPVQLRRYKRKSVDVGVFEKEVGKFERKFQTK